MNIKDMKGEFLYRALVRKNLMDCPVTRQLPHGFELTEKYYRSKEEVYLDYLVGDDILWPVDEVDRGVMYIPDPSEYND